MKLVLTTVYENVDQDWLDWWLAEFGRRYGAKSLPHTLTSKDPTSDVVGTTTIEVVTVPESEMT